MKIAPVTRTADGAQLTIDSETADALGLTRASQVAVFVIDGALHIQPISPSTVHSMEGYDALDGQYDDVLEKLGP